MTYSFRNPRAECGHCGQVKRVRRDGTVQRHIVPGRPTRDCPGSLRPPKAGTGGR